MTGIYIIKNKKGECYIGESLDIEKRFKQHKIVQKKTKLGLSFLKYGIENHSFEVLEYCKAEDLYRKERYYIKKYDSFNRGLNSTKGTFIQPRCIYISNKEKANLYKLLN